MKKAFYIIGLAALAITGCTLNEAYVNPDVPRVDKPLPVIKYEGSGNLVTGAIGEEKKLNSTYSWEAKDNAITINIGFDLTEYIEGGGWELGYFFLDLDSINDYLGILVTSDTNEENFYGVEPDGSKVDYGDSHACWTSYMPGMWINADGTASGSGGTNYWQWYIWTGRDGIYYDYGEGTDKTYNGLFLVGGNPGNIAGKAESLAGTTVTSKAKLIANGESYDFVVNIKYSEYSAAPLPETEGYQEEPMDAGLGGYSYSSGVEGNHQWSWYFDEEGLNVDVDLVSTADEPIEDWGVLGIVISPEIMTGYLGITDINQLADISYFYPLAGDGSALEEWTSYVPGQWVDAEGNATNWQGIFYWQYQFGENKYDGHFTEGLLVVGVNPGNISSVAGQTVVSKAKLGDKLMTVSVHFHDAMPTTKTGKIGPHTYTWTVGEDGFDFTTSVSLAAKDDSWNWYGVTINQKYINQFFDLNAACAPIVESEDIFATSDNFYPVDEAGARVEKWSSYGPGMWYGKDGSVADYSSGYSFWQYYTVNTYDYDIPNLMLLGNNPGFEHAVGDTGTSTSKVYGKDWTVTINVAE